MRAATPTPTPAETAALPCSALRLTDQTQGAIDCELMGALVERGPRQPCRIDLDAGIERHAGGRRLRGGQVGQVREIDLPSGSLPIREAAVGLQLRIDQRDPLRYGVIERHQRTAGRLTSRRVSL